MTSLEVLTNDQRAQVHERTLHVLEHTGMRVDSDEGRRILRDAGARVDEATRIVRCRYARRRRPGSARRGPAWGCAATSRLQRKHGGVETRRSLTGRVPYAVLTGPSVACFDFMLDAPGVSDSTA
jgi:hypothetical protein